MFSIYNNGKPSPMGYSQTQENGLKISNFALFSSAADTIELCLFRGGKESRFAMSRTDDIWRVAIEGVELNDEYAFRITAKNDRTLILNTSTTATTAPIFLIHRLIECAHGFFV